MEATKSPVNLTWALLKALFFKPGAKINDNRRRIFLGISLLVVLPVLIGFGIEDVLAARLGSALLDSLAVAILAICIILLRFMGNAQNLYRLSVGFMSVLLLYYTGSGANGGSSILWLFSLPPATFFLLVSSGFRSTHWGSADKYISSIRQICTRQGYIKSDCRQYNRGSVKTGDYTFNAHRL